MDGENRCPECGAPFHIEDVVTCGVTIQKKAATCNCKEERRIKELQEKIQAARNEMRISAGLLPRHIDMTFKKFQPNHAQIKAYTMSQQFVNDYVGGKSLAGLILNGGVGCGKTHLLCAVLNDLIERYEFTEHQIENIGYKSAYSPYFFISSIGLFEGIRKTFNRDDSSEDILNRCKKTKVLFIDDIGANKSSEWVKEQFLNIIDYRYNHYLPILLSTNLRLKDELIKCIGARTVDRLKSMCVNVTINDKSHRIPQNSKAV